MQRTLMGLAGVAIGAVLLAGCGSSNNNAGNAPATTASTTPSSKPPTTSASARSTSTTTAGTEKSPNNDNSCGPVEICGTASVSGGQTLSTPFFSALKDLNNAQCGDWAKGTDGKLRLPVVRNAEQTLSLVPDDPIAYKGPDSYAGADVLKDATLSVNDKKYAKGKGTAEVKISDNGNGSITLTNWTEDGESSGAVTVKITWTCTNR